MFRLFVKERKPKTSAEASKLAEDYIVARKEDATNAKFKEEEKSPGKQKPVLRWSKCAKNSFLTRDGRQLVKTEIKQETPRRPKRDLKNLECFNCHEKGHCAFQCPRTAHFYKESRETKEDAHSVNVKKREKLLLFDVHMETQSCEVCQRVTRHKIRRAPMIPLPIVEEPFSQIAMDIIGPLPVAY